MSIEYVRAVLELDQPIGLQRLLLIAIAEHADRNGFAEPGNDCLAAETKISTRQIQRMLHAMEGQWIETLQAGNGRGRRRTLRLLFAPATLTKRVTTEAIKGDIKGDIICHPLPTQKDDIGTEKGDKRVTSERERVTLGAIKGDMLPEKTPDNPMNPINPEPIGGGIDQDLPTPPREAAPPPPPFSQKRLLQSPTKPLALAKPPVRIQSPHLRNPRKFVGGYIPAGQGANPVEVWYESFSINDDRWRLSAPQEDDLTKRCPDLARLREVCQTYARHGHYAPRNLQLTFDWYEKGLPNRGKTAIRSQTDEHDYDFSSYQPQLIQTATAA